MVLLPPAEPLVQVWTHTHRVYETQPDWQELQIS